MAALSRKIQDRLREKGYVTVRTAAEKIGQNRPVLDRKAREGTVRSLEVAGVRVVEWASVLEDLGPETVEALGLEPLMVPTPLRNPKPPAQPDPQRALQAMLEAAKLELPVWMRPKTR